MKYRTQLKYVVLANLIIAHVASGSSNDDKEVLAQANFAEYNQSAKVFADGSIEVTSGDNKTVSLVTEYAPKMYKYAIHRISIAEEGYAYSKFCLCSACKKYLNAGTKKRLKHEYMQYGDSDTVTDCNAFIDQSSLGEEWTQVNYSKSRGDDFSREVRASFNVKKDADEAFTDLKISQDCFKSFLKPIHGGNRDVLFSNGHDTLLGLTTKLRLYVMHPNSPSRSNYAIVSPVECSLSHVDWGSWKK